MKRMKWLLPILCFLLLAGCTASNEKVIKTEGLKECKPLVDEFYADLADTDPIRMTTTMNGSVATVFTRDGDKMHVEDLMNGMDYYLFKENGKTWYMTEGEEPMKEDVMYEFTQQSVRMALSLFVTGIFEADSEEGLSFSAVQTEKDGTITLETSVKASQDGTEAEIATTGTKTNDRVTNITVYSSSGETVNEYVYDFAYDVSVDLPEHTIKDMSQYYHHVESPYATVEDYLATLEDRNDFNYIIYSDQIVTLAEKDGRYYQLTANISEEEYQELEALDTEAEDYQEKLMDFIGKLAVTDCVDYTDAVLSAEAMGEYVGKKGTELLNDGFESMGYSVSEEGSTMIFTKDGMEYEAEVTLPEGFDIDADFEAEDLAEGMVLTMRFLSASFSVLPLE